MIDRYPEIMSTLKYHHFQIFTEPHDSYIPSSVREFYASYKSLIPPRRKQAISLKLVDSVVVRGKIVRCDPDSINAILGQCKGIEDACEHIIGTKKSG